MTQMRGYTLIEILVVIGIIGLMSTGAVASYNTFTKRARVEQAARLIASQLRAVQKDVTSGTSDCGATAFDGVELALVTDGNGKQRIAVKNVCGGTVNATERTSFPNPSFEVDLTISSFPTFRILTVSGGSNSNSEITVKSTATTDQATYAVGMTMAGGVSVTKKE